GLLCTAAGAQPANDTCSGAIPIGLGAVNGQTLGATPDTTNEEDVCGNSDRAPDVYYRFVAPATATFEVLTCDASTDYDTVLSVHSACPATAGNRIACNDDAGAPCRDLASYLTFNAVQNQT